MQQAAKKAKHPYIARQKSHWGGRAGTKFPVRSVVQYVLREGMTPEDLVREFSHLNLAQVYDALSYYYDHRQEIDQDLAEHTEAGMASSR
jgi:uncharacterized protein (DUF433 family)